ncbi:class III signal peptide-containing protein [Methanothermobacter sp. KEPCO-1]|uniref:class III signal peptide-containing protein n=1 Tax=unclassified Methanothermobacter TaxID=2631116 RepID=UPI0011C8C535|nr:class III signal peptide-containing protein [Methanothermobacter sp. KEPCO-1]QEF94865.1 class III signal peptide-containing protein [Methanothermobacter sp. KEPCO-1]
MSGGLIADDSGQGSAELILVFGGIIVIVTFAVVWYRNYVSSSQTAMNSDVQNVTNSIKGLKNKF